jgi:tetratricopeptide (TPR) repeat protein
LANFQTEREQLLLLESLFKQKQFIAGLVQVDEVLQQFPSSFHLKFLKVSFLKELGKTDQALQALLEMHSRFGDNILILKELADLNFAQNRFPESLLYYKKLLFLDSFNVQAQERVKQINDMLEAGVSAKLSDTTIEVRQEDTRPLAEAVPAPAITFEEQPTGTEVLLEEKPAVGREPELNFETESAAELYFKQGLYKDSLAIYKKLFEKSGKTDYFLKVKAILLLQRNEKNAMIIQKLQRLLELIQKRGSQFVRSNF